MSQRTRSGQASNPHLGRTAGAGSRHDRRSGAHRCGKTRVRPRNGVTIHGNVKPSAVQKYRGQPSLSERLGFNTCTGRRKADSLTNINVGRRLAHDVQPVRFLEAQERQWLSAACCAEKNTTAPALVPSRTKLGSISLCTISASSGFLIVRSERSEPGRRRRSSRHMPLASRSLSSTRQSSASRKRFLTSESRSLPKSAQRIASTMLDLPRAFPPNRKQCFTLANPEQAIEG